jgi:parallel beta-helix repeat protein
MLRRTFSAVIIAVLLTGILTVAFNIQPVRASGTVYVRADGSIDPPTAPIQRNGDIYTLTGNITADVDGIVIERDNIVLNGAGYTVNGNGYGRNGITLTNVSNVTVRNTTIEIFDSGIYLESSSNCILSNNNVANNWWDGIILHISFGNTLSGNNVTANQNGGIWLSSSSNNILSGNNATANYGAGIRLSSSPNNTLFHNNVTANYNGGYYGYYIGGIMLESFSNSNVLSGNNVTANNLYGIELNSSSDNVLSGNNVAESGYGLYFTFSSNNILSGNNVTANINGGIVLYSSSGNSIYHNNFINNTLQAISDGYPNTWNNAYPSGGNYWSDYLTQYPNPAEIDNSSIWNTPYDISNNDKDHYPLMQTWQMPYTNATYLTVVTQNMNGQTISGMDVTVSYGALSQSQTTSEGETTFWLGQYSGTVYLNITATSAYKAWSRTTIIAAGYTVFYATLQETPQPLTSLQLLQQYAWAIITAIGVGVILIAVVYVMKRRRRSDETTKQNTRQLPPQQTSSIESRARSHK